MTRTIYAPMLDDGVVPVEISEEEYARIKRIRGEELPKDRRFATDPLLRQRAGDRRKEDRHGT